MTDKIIRALKINPEEKRVRIEPGSRDRGWMDDTHNKYAYRCLPLTIANQHGWCVYLNGPMSFVWNGGNDPSDIKIINDTVHAGTSIFGYGVFTFHVMHLITLPDNYNLFISGAPNFIKPGIQPLTGVFEADWAPYTFTMNWKITEPNRIITFNNLDPICFFFPVPRGLVEEFKFEFDNISNHPVLDQQHKAFAESRLNFVKLNQQERIEQTGSDWQKNYFQGKYPDGSKCPFAHQTKLDLDQPKDEQEIKGE